MAVKYKCAQRMKDKNGIIVEYFLWDEQGKLVHMLPEQLKSAIALKQITVTNLKLTSDGRLIVTREKDSSKNNDFNTNKDKVLGLIKSEFGVEFRTDQRSASCFAYGLLGNIGDGTYYLIVDMTLLDVYMYLAKSKNISVNDIKYNKINIMDYSDDSITKAIKIVKQLIKKNTIKSNGTIVISKGFVLADSLTK